MTDKMLDITPSPRLLQVLGDIPLANWQCLAELVDNSLDELLTTPLRAADNPLHVDITIEQGTQKEAHLVVRDNGTGMTLEELERSLRAGHSSKSRYGSLGLFGMGFNIATARMGTSTTVETTTAGSAELLSVTVDFAELQKQETFYVPVIRRPCSRETTGTTVRIRLKRAIAEELRRDTAAKALEQRLGDVYSYLLRTSVPGINKVGFSAPIFAVLTLNGEKISPQLPCIWADGRKVISAGSEVSAVQYIDVILTEATACLHCGYWDRKNGPETCEECGSQSLELRQRRIWGWIGIQRYIDSTHYGIDFFRYGRKILMLDKTVFTYTDPDTLQTEVEYPIEMPANRGRIIGEIHLDHVPVTYQKNDFDRQSRDWQVAIERLRGDGPLKPRASTRGNMSPLAMLYSAFRRNDPGLRYLTPGDGSRAIHDKAKEWAALFEKGIARYLDDTEWYEAAERHQRIKDNLDGGDIEETGKGAGQPTVIDTLLGGVPPSGTSTAIGELGTQYQKPATREDLFTKARLRGAEREDLSGQFKLGKELGTWQVTVVTTKQRLDDAAGSGSPPACPGIIKGTDVEVFVWDEHPIFREFGRDVRDVALIQAAEIIKGYRNSSRSIAEVYGELVQQVSDLKTTEEVILGRINRLFERIRELMYPVISVDPTVYWDVLSTFDKTEVETAAGVNMPTVPFEVVVDDGRFTKFVAPDGIRDLVESKANDFFDGRVFIPGIANRNAEARLRVIGSVLRDIAALHDFQKDHLLRQKHDIALALISLEHLESQLASEDIQS